MLESQDRFGKTADIQAFENSKCFDMGPGSYVISALDTRGGNSCFKRTYDRLRVQIYCGFL
jgi:hypothetical protein